MFNEKEADKKMNPYYIINLRKVGFVTSLAYATKGSSSKESWENFDDAYNAFRKLSDWDRARSVITRNSLDRCEGRSEFFMPVWQINKMLCLINGNDETDRQFLAAQQKESK